MLGAQGGRIDPAARERSKLGLIAEEHIGFGEKALEDSGARRMIEVEREGTFVAIGRQEIGGLRADEGWSPAARLIADAGTLDLDDVGPKIAEKHGAVRARESFG